MLDIPNNLALKYSSTDEAISAYMEALNAGIVRRVQLQTSPDGHAYVFVSNFDLNHIIM